MTVLALCVILLGCAFLMNLLNLCLLHREKMLIRAEQEERLQKMQRDMIERKRELLKMKNADKVAIEKELQATKSQLNKSLLG